MDKKKFKKIVGNRRHIPGIYNYCDKWCKRCTKTLRCSVYAMEQEEKENSRFEDSDTRNELFWNHLHDIFKTTIEMVQDYAEENEIDLDEAEFEEYEKKQEHLHKETMSHSVVSSGTLYKDSAQKWFTTKEDLFKHITEQFESRHQMELPDDNPENECVNLYNAMEIVQWYHTIIFVKLARAVRQKLEPWEPEEEIQSDRNGSAKAALLGIDRSIWAWSVVLKSMPEQEKEILDFLVQLERLRRETERTFPQARAFIRPGFDE